MNAAVRTPVDFADTLQHVRDKAMSNDDMPIVVFAGPYAEAIFLKTLIESAGQPTTER